MDPGLQQSRGSWSSNLLEALSKEGSMPMPTRLPEVFVPLDCPHVLPQKEDPQQEEAPSWSVCAVVIVSSNNITQQKR